MSALANQRPPVARLAEHVSCHDSGEWPGTVRGVEQPPEESRVAAKRAPSDDYLVVALECGRPLAGSARYALRNVDRVVIGRGDERRAERFVDGDLATLDARVPGLAPQHARLVRVGNGWAIEDLGSESGTVVNGVRVDCAVLAPDDIVELGHTLFRVLSGVATPEGTAEDLEAAAASEGVLATLDPTLTRRMEMSAKLATSSVPLLLLGESGTGKEVAARWLHGKTGRNGPFVAVNCGAIPTMLVESQLFGHVKGAFSGALRDEPGLIRAAEGGTLFLDEIGELPKTSQAALLRVLQEREVVPVGATRPVRVDFRLLAATNAPLGEMVERGEFRRDLLARIAGMTVVLPSLRERRFDVGMLVATLLRRLAGDRAGAMTFTPEAGRALLSYEWPFNVRELEQSLATCVALNGADGVVELDHLASTIAASLHPSAISVSATDGLSVRDRQLQLQLLEKLAVHSGNLTEVAHSMGKARTQIQRWCRRFGIDANVYRR